MTSLRRSAFVLVVLLLLAWPPVAHAQSGAIVNGAVGAFASDKATDFDINGGIGGSTISACSAVEFHGLELTAEITD